MGNEMKTNVIKRRNFEFIPVDKWEPEPYDEIFKQIKGAIILPVSQFYHLEQSTFLDYFQLIAKRCYNGDKIREHLTKYLNYFEKYYDTDKELLAVYYRIKYLIDCEDKSVYNERAFMYDLNKYILHSSLFEKSRMMNEDNYFLDLDRKRLDGKRIRVPSLQYTDKHGKILMHMSLLQDMFIPLVVHYMTVRNVMHIKDFLLRAFDMIFKRYPDVDMYSKLYETAISSVNKNADVHSVLWNMQEIRAKNTTTHSIAATNDIILQIMPKYTYDANIISFNYKSILYNIRYQVTDISYEYSFVTYSSSERDAENNSEFDKFESHLTKQDESLYMQNAINSESTMKNIELMFGPFDDDEIDFYMKRLSMDNKFTINTFQKDLVFNLFYKYFGDPVSIKAINSRDYIKLIIAAKRLLLANGLIVLPYILSSHVKRVMTRKNVNKKELTKLQTSEYYPLVKDKYKNDKIENQILSMIAGILSSEFEIIEYNDDTGEIDGMVINSLGDYIIEEVLVYIMLI